MRLVEPMEGYEYDPDEYATFSSETESDTEKSLVPLEHEESVQIIKPQVEYSELDDVFSEELDDLDLRDFFIEKKQSNNRVCQVTTSLSTVQPEKTEPQPMLTVSPAISAHPFMELNL